MRIYDLHIVDGIVTITRVWEQQFFLLWITEILTSILSTSSQFFFDA